jgi:hypothetical protein
MTRFREDATQRSRVKWTGFSTAAKLPTLPVSRNPLAMGKRVAKKRSRSSRCAGQSAELKVSASSFLFHATANPFGSSVVVHSLRKRLLCQLFDSARFGILADCIELSPKLVNATPRKLSPHALGSLFVVGSMVQQMSRKARGVHTDNTLEIARVDSNQLNASTPVLDRASVEPIETIRW